MTNPSRIEEWHWPFDSTKLAELTESMSANGWQGAPIVVIEREDCDPKAITGSHRLAAARSANIDVPTVDLAELLAAHGTSLDALDEKYGNLEGDHFEAIVRLDHHLPAEVIEFYGLDTH